MRRITRHWHRLIDRTAAARDDSGAVAIVVVLFTAIFIVILAFVVDGGSAYATKAQLQNAADSGALAGAATLSCSGGNSSAAIAAAVAYGELNATEDGSLHVATVTGTTVRTTASVNMPTVFGAIVNRPNIPVSASAGAAKDCTGGYAAFAGTGSFNSSGAVTVSGSVYSGSQSKFTSGNSQVTGVVDVHVASGGLCQGSCAIYSDAAKTVPNPPQPKAAKAPACYAYEIGLDGNGGSACTPTQSSTSGLIQQLPTTSPTRLVGTTTAMCTLNDAWWNNAIWRQAEYLDCGSRNVTISRWDNSYPLRAIKTSGRILLAASFASGNSNARTRSVGTSSRAVLLYSTNSGSAQNNSAIDIQGNNSMNHFGYLYAPGGAVYANGNGNLRWTGTMIASGITVKGTGSGGGIVGFLAAVGIARLTE